MPPSYRVSWSSKTFLGKEEDIFDSKAKICHSKLQGVSWSRICFRKTLLCLPRTGSPDQAKLFLGKSNNLNTDNKIVQGLLVKQNMLRKTKYIHSKPQIFHSKSQGHKHKKHQQPTLVPLKGVFESQGPPPLSVVTTTTVLSIRPRCFRSTNT